ncbi:MAG: type IV toxin-antitoxin system AbiEi family antitoxin domain-containing protein [Verrucomicrobia bacterium]|nr:type IV toxin-antitoxin system AbiEi family antitoxin domain-containing protein [Verrucomicrobiota bacterium]
MSLRYPIESKTNEKVMRVFENHGGVLRFSEAVRLGVRPGTLREMVEADQLDQLARGLYKLKSTPELSDPDLVIVAAKIPKAVICLVSALNFHHITTHSRGEVDILLPRGSHPPVLDYPPIRVHSAVPSAYELGQEVHHIDGVNVTVTDPEKTLVDCVKHRNDLGKEILLEALRLYRERLPQRLNRLFAYAKTCRVEAILRPYVEAMVHE